MSIVSKVIKYIDLINSTVGKIFSWVILLLTGIVVYEVIARYFFNHPSICNFEITKQIFGFHFIILGGFILLTDNHVSIDVFQRKFPKRIQKIVDVVCFVCLFFPFTVIMFWNGIRLARIAWEQQEKVWSVCSSPLYPIKTVIPIAFFLLILQGISTFYKKMKQ